MTRRRDDQQRSTSRDVGVAITNDGVRGSVRFGERESYRTTTTRVFAGPPNGDGNCR